MQKETFLLSYHTSPFKYMKTGRKEWW